MSGLLLNLLWAVLPTRTWATRLVEEGDLPFAEVVRYDLTSSGRFATGVLVADPQGLALLTRPGRATAFTWADIAGIRAVRNVDGFLDRFEIVSRGPGARVVVIPQHPMGGTYSHAELERLLQAIETYRAGVQA